MEDKKVFKQWASGQDTKGYYPVTDKGHMIEYIYGGATDTVYWLPMEVFKASLKFINYEQGRSSFRLILEDVDTERRYSLMLNSLSEFITKSVDGIVWDGEWIVVKRGANYGLIDATNIK